MPEVTCQEAPTRKIGQAIRRLRGEELQDSLARRAGIRPATLSAIETGTGNPRIGTLAKIARALGQPLEAFMCEPANKDAA